MVIAVIPAKGVSSRIPRKNLQIIEGIPLVEWSLRTAKAWERITRIITITDDNEIAALAKLYGSEVIPCEKEDTQDAVTTSRRWMKMCKKLPDTDTALFQPTTPFRTLRSLESQWAAYEGADVCISVSKLSKALFDENGVPGLPPEQQLTRLSQNEPSRFTLEGFCILSRTGYLAEAKHLYEGDVRMFEVGCLESIDIDWPEDLAFARLIAGVAATQSGY